MYQQPVASATFRSNAHRRAVRCDLCRSTRRDLFSHSVDGVYSRCLNCDLIYGVAEADELPQFYDNTYFTRYADRVSAGARDQPAWSKRWHRKAQARLSSMEPFRRNGTFLEIGCSLGDFLNVVKQSGWDVVGVEISQAAANYSREKWGLDVRTGTIESVSPTLRTSFFDVVWAANLMEHVVSPNSFLASIEKLLRPGGVLIASTLNSASWAFQFSGSRWEYLHSAREHRYVFNPALLDRYCEANGLRIAKTVTTGFRWVNKNRRRAWYTPGIRMMERAISKFARVANRGHRIEFWAVKPEQSASALPGSTSATEKPRLRRAA